MNRRDIAKMVANATTLTHKDAVVMVAKVFEMVALSLACGEEVQIRDFGTFYATERAATVRPHPTTGEPMNCPPVTIIKFRPAKKARQKVQ